MISDAQIGFKKMGSLNAKMLFKELIQNHLFHATTIPIEWLAFLFALAQISNDFYLLFTLTIFSIAYLFQLFFMQRITKFDCLGVLGFWGFSDLVSSIFVWLLVFEFCWWMSCFCSFPFSYIFSFLPMHNTLILKPYDISRIINII